MYLISLLNMVLCFRAQSPRWADGLASGDTAGGDAEPEERRGRPEDEASIVKEEKLRIKVYPNPTKDYFIIESSSDLTELSVAVYDVYGNVVVERKEMKFKQVSIDTKEWASGIYLWQVKALGKKAEHGKVNVMRW